ncbi:MAG: SagB/ThcOx family dehydrogenase [Caldimonas sp.]
MHLVCPSRGGNKRMPGTRRSTLAALTALAGAMLTVVQSPGVAAAAESTTSAATIVVALPAPNLGQAGSVEDALRRRRSSRSYAARPIALATIAQLLWAAQGTTDSQGRRTAPSAGALYPLELHLVAARVEGLAPGVYRYLPATHSLRLATDGPAAPALMHAAMDQPAVGMAGAVVVIAVVEERSAHKYGVRAGRYATFEAGAAAQNLALQATAIGLGSVVVGAFDDLAVARTLGLAPNERPVALMPIGWPA